MTWSTTKVKIRKMSKRICETSFRSRERLRVEEERYDGLDSTRTRRQNDDVFDANHEDRIEEHRGLDQTEKSDTDEETDQVSTGFQIPYVSVVPCS